MTYWTAVYTDAQAEPQVQRKIEARGVGTFLPWRKIVSWRGSHRQIRAAALLPRYVLVNLPDKAFWGWINDIAGANHVLKSGDAPARISADEVANLMSAYTSGRYDTILPRRDPAGRFRKHRKRRRRPRKGKKIAKPQSVGVIPHL